MKDFAPGEGLPEQSGVVVPGSYRVVIVNDDYTSMVFAISILMHVFSMPFLSAMDLVSHAHDTGRAVAGVYPAQMAETKAWLANTVSRHEGHPLLFVMEKA